MAMANRDGAWYVTRVDAGGEAARAGIAVGDRIAWRNDAETYRLAYVTVPGHPFSVSVDSPGKAEREVTLTRSGMFHGTLVEGRTGASRLVTLVPTFLIYVIPSFLAALIVWRRVSVLTIAFAAYSIFGDLDRPFSLSGSTYYYPSVSGMYTGPMSHYLGMLSGATFAWQYRVLKYEAGATYAFGSSPLFVEAGFIGDSGSGKEYAPSNYTHTAIDLGGGLHF
jgi:hypothetical protein